MENASQSLFQIFLLEIYSCKYFSHRFQILFFYKKAFSSYCFVVISPSSDNRTRNQLLSHETKFVTKKGYFFLHFSAPMMVLRTLAIQILTYFYFALFLNLKKKFNERRRRICALSEASYENFYSILHYHFPYVFPHIFPYLPPPIFPPFFFHLFPRHFPHHFCGNFYSILHSHFPYPSPIFPPPFFLRHFVETSIQFCIPTFPTHSFQLYFMRLFSHFHLQRIHSQKFRSPLSPFY